MAIRLDGRPDYRGLRQKVRVCLEKSIPKLTGENWTIVNSREKLEMYLANELLITYDKVAKEFCFAENSGIEGVEKRRLTKMITDEINTVGIRKRR